MTTAETVASRPPVLDRMHDVFVLLLLALRPLCWDGAPGQAADLIWQALAVGALAIVAVERASGLQESWRWSWRGAIAVLLVVAVLPATLNAAEPAPAWCRWSGWVACIAAAAYLIQVIPGRRHLAVAGLAGGAVVTVLLGLAQPWLVLPAMAAAQEAGDSVFHGIAGDPGAIAERIANGGAFATFTLANQFGAYLALVFPVLAGLAWVSRGMVRATAVALIVLALAAMVGTGAKGAWLALGAGCAAGWAVAWPGRWWRWLPLALGVIAFVVLLQRGFAQASTEVRLGYWRSAVTLVEERPLSGWGLGGFAAQQPRVLQVGDEPTRFAHNEILEAAVAGGWLLGGLLVVALVALAWPRRCQPADPPDPETSHRAVTLALLCAVPYLAVLGAFDGNLGWWPGGGALVGILLWSLLLGAVGALAAWLVWRSPTPPAWAWTAGLTAVALKALIDFDLHAAGLAGTAVMVAAIAPGRVHHATGIASRVGPLVAAVLTVVVVLMGVVTAVRLADADDWVASARASQDPMVAQGLALRLGLPPDRSPRDIAAAAAMRAWEQGDGAPGTQVGALDFLPNSPQTLAMADGLAERAPHSAAVALRHARLLSASRDHLAATAEAERAVRCAPTAPRVLDAAADILSRAAASLPAMIERASALRAEAQRLRPLVHPGMRN